MAEHLVKFTAEGRQVSVPTGTLLIEAARKAGVEIGQPCGGQGRCGRCVVQVENGGVRSRSSLRLSSEDLSLGYTLACQAVVEGDVTVHVPPQEQVLRRIGEGGSGEVYEAVHTTLQRVYALKLIHPEILQQPGALARFQEEARRSADGLAGMNRRHPDSNWGIKVLQTSALPLGYGASTKKLKAGNETRTRDSHLGKVALYQLSYSRFWSPELIRRL